MRRTPYVLRIALFSLFVAACGPASCCGSAEVENFQQAHDASLLHAVQGFQHTRPIGEAWPEILAVMSEHGFPLDAPTPVEGRTLQSAYKEKSRILLRVIRVDGGHWKLTIESQDRQVDNDGGETFTVDRFDARSEPFAIAWTIVQRVEPVEAAKLEATANARAESAAARGRTYDRGCSACGNLLLPH